MQKIPTKSAAVKPQVSAPKGVEQYLQELDALLKRNTGSGLHVGEDTSSNSPMYIPGKVRNPGGLGESAPSVSQYGNGMTAPEPRQRPAPIQEIPQEQPQEEGLSQLEQFIEQFNQSVYPSQFGGTTPSQSEGIATLSDGGTLGQDGVVRYSDGTVREYKDPNARGIASMQDGSIQYSDGTFRRKAPQGIASLQGNRERILMDDGTAQYGKYQPNFSPNVLPGGTQGLVSGIFGQDRPVTQEYGNINPIEPTPGHVNYGTDLRTKDLAGSQRQLKLPVGAKVIEVLQDDGTRYGDRSGHKGYGNSILVQLPTGEMLRFSHLSSMMNVQPGQDIPAGTVFGTPGRTGNTTGEHLDLEYYDQNGQIANPGQFSGFSSPEGMRQEVAGQPAPGTRVPASEMPQQPQMSSQMPVQVAQQSKPVAQKTGQVLGTSIQAPQLSPQEQNTQAADKMAAFGTALGAPELKTNELVSQQGTNPIRQLAGNTIDALSTPFKKVGLPDTGFSELIAGGKTTNTDKNLAPGAYAYDDKGDAVASKPPTASDYANVFSTNLKDAGKYAGEQVGGALAKAGQGIQGLANAGASSLENIFKPNQVEAKRAIGDIPGTVDAGGNPNFSSLQDTANSKAGTPKNDIRDAFFKQGGSDIFKDFLRPGAEDSSGGALSLDLFNNDFFGDLGRITSVFGGSKDLNPAVEKYVQMEQQKYKPMEKMGYQDGYDRGEIDSYNKSVDQYNSELNSYFNSIRSSVQGVPSSFSPNIPGSAKNVFASSAPSSRVSAAPSLNYSSASGPQLASISKPTAQMSQPSKSSPSLNFTPVNANTSTNRGPVYSPAPAPKPASQAPKPQTFTPSNANTSTVRGAVYTPPPKASTPAPQSKPSSNIFSTVKSFINNIFRR